MRWLDAVELDPRGRVRGVARIRDDNPLLVAGELPGLALAELLAQAGAARAGIEARARGASAGDGYLIAIRELELGAGAAAVGALLEVSAEVEVLREDERGEYSELSGEVRLGAQRLARGSLGLLRAHHDPPRFAPPATAGGAGLSLAELRFEGESLHGRVLVPRDGPLLAGHFPGHPVLPAAAQLLAVVAAARSGWAEVAPRRLERAKFARPVLPGNALSLGATLRDRVLRFELREPGEPSLLVSAGTINLAPARSRPGGGG
jgi:predicted hotdog family 3-hydroxylacyl-ACP dehydratase